MSEQWTITCKVFRVKGEEKPHYDNFTLTVNPNEYVLDAVERIWAFHDRTLCFRHACHHTTCGACGMRVNHVEKLTCMTLIRSVTQDGGTIILEPLRNFPIISDLVVDMGQLYLKMDEVKAPTVLPIQAAEIEKPKDSGKDDEAYLRLADCIECGLCVSACPVSLTTKEYLGPVTLAGAHLRGLDQDGNELLSIIDQEDGIWRCHSAYECTSVCPSFVDPARRIMDLRKQVIGKKIKSIFGSD